MRLLEEVCSGVFVGYEYVGVFMGLEMYADSRVAAMSEVVRKGSDCIDAGC